MRTGMKRGEGGSWADLVVVKARELNSVTAVS